jgi:hypothetical protein
VLVAEGFSPGAFLFGPLWLAFHRAWLFAAIALVVDVAVSLLAPVWASLVLAWLLGMFGRDLVRLGLDLRGYTLVHVVAASDEDSALARLLARRPDLIGESVR